MRGSAYRNIFVFIILLILAGYWGFSKVAYWLSKADIPSKVEVMVCLGGEERVKKAGDLYRQGLAPEVIFTATKDKTLIPKNGIPVDRTTLAPYPLTTYQEALAVAPIVKKAGYQSAIVVTDPYHLRRVRWTFNHVLSDQPIKLTFVSTDAPFLQEKWWQDKQSSYHVVSEISKIGYYWMLYGVMGIEEEPSWLLDMKSKYERFLRKICS